MRLAASFSSYNELQNVCACLTLPASDDVITVALTSCPEASGVQSCMPCAPAVVWSGIADSGRRVLRSAADRTCVVARTRNTSGDNCCRSAGVEQFTISLTTGHQPYGQYKRQLETSLFGSEMTTTHGCIFGP